MIVNEYAILSRAFTDSFGFMLNRIDETHGLGKERDASLDSVAEERCWNEFCLAIEALGLEFEFGKGNSNA